MSDLVGACTDLGSKDPTMFVEIGKHYFYCKRFDPVCSIQFKNISREIMLFQNVSQIENKKGIANKYITNWRPYIVSKPT